MNFWENVDEELKYSGKTRKELAKEADFDVSYISKGIARDGMPLADLALRISHALDVPLENLLGITKKSDDKEATEKRKIQLLKKYDRLIKTLENFPYEKQEEVIIALTNFIKLLS